MSIVGLNLEASRIYVSKHDSGRGTEDETKFTLGTLDSRVYGKLVDKSTTMVMPEVENKKDSGDNGASQDIFATINQNEVDHELVAFGVTNIEGLVNDKGEAIPFATKNRTLGSKTYRVVDPEVLRRIPLQVIRELAGEIRKDNDFDEEQVKNSDRQ